MKNIIISKFIFSVFTICFVLLSFMTVSCTSNKIDGVWKQTAYYKLANNDTIQKNFSKIQHKIYLDGYVMWNSDAGSDNIDWHGYGKYSIKKDTIIESLISMSVSLKGYTTVFPITYKINNNTLKQIIHYTDKNINYQNIEIYQKIN